MAKGFNCFRILMFSLFSASSLFAQTTANFAINLNLTEVAILDIESQNGSSLFNFLLPTEAGISLVIPSTNTSNWLNYTSAKRESSPTRNITARVDQVLSGIAIKMQASSSSGVGAIGTTTGKVTLTTNPIIIINGIGGAFTGNGVNKGHQLNISLEVNNYSELIKTTNKIVTITYTISN